METNLKKSQEEMEKQFDKGKRNFSFQEISDILEKNDGIPQEETKRILEEMQDEQKSEK